ncbi:MAG: pirin family protein [Dehalococcoidia bacterium]|nr:pirin family protein [Dehalococcoidia bacterium]
MPAESLRSVTRVIDSLTTFEGEGFLVHRPFPTAGLADADPFLLLDEMGPMDLAPGEAKGAPDHPHRGFETVTYILEGAFQHEDSAGHAGALNPGDVQWMTAGAGVIHSEMPSDRIRERGGRIHGFQLWVNLPRRDKMIAPCYQDMPAAKIPEAATPDGTVRVRVIAGEALGHRAVIDTRTPITYLHFTLAPGASVVQPLPPDQRAFAYVFAGAGFAGRDSTPIARGQMALFASDGASISLRADVASVERPLQALVIAGVPLGEPVARYGPFVMNTKEEIAQAVRDYQGGRMGHIAR